MINVVLNNKTCSILRNSSLRKFTAVSTPKLNEYEIDSPFQGT